MGVYRRKDKNGRPYGPWIIQYPYAVDPVTGKVKYTSEKVGQSKRLADLAFAKKMLEWEKKKHLGLEARKDYSFGELVDWYLGLPVAKKKRSYDKDEQRSKTLKEFFGQMKASGVKPAMIESFQQEMLGRKSSRATSYKPATVNRMLALMKRIYNLALREELVEKNPCFKVAMLAENNKRDRVISQEAFNRLLSHLPNYAANIVLTAYHTGMRSGEIINLTWDRVNLKEGFIDLREEDTKTNEPRRIYLPNPLRDLFSRLSKVRQIRQNFVFTNRGMPVRSIRSAFKTACKKAGIEDFRIHDLRHTFNTNMRKAGAHRSVIMKITGHKTGVMFERYNTVDADDARLATRLYEDYLGLQITSSLLQGPSEPKKTGQAGLLNPLI